VHLENSASRLRAAVTPAGRGRGASSSREGAQGHAPKHVSLTWMQRLKRVFAIEIERCQRCGGALKVIASIEDRVLIERILAHVGQPAEEGLAPFVSRGRRGRRRAAEARALPRYVDDEFEAYLKCGLLEHGFLRVKCESCQAEKLVAFSCKRRGFCPSCGARRMAETVALLVDDVLPRQPVRQWVLSLPFALRYSAGDPAGGGHAGARHHLSRDLGPSDPQSRLDARERGDRGRDADTEIRHRARRCLSPGRRGTPAVRYGVFNAQRSRPPSVSDSRSVATGNRAQSFRHPRSILFRSK
jgi:ribosomal protein S27E